jgi:AcrR family transcriptional regulator
MQKKVKARRKPAAVPSMQKKPKARRKPAEVRRQDVIAAALDIIRKHGVEKLTTRALSQAVGIAQPTLFLHFGNKTRLLVLLVDAIQARLQEGLKGQALERLTPLERLKTVIRFHLNFIQNQPGIPRLLFSEELQNGDPAFRKRMNEMVGNFLQFLTGLIQAAQQTGDVRKDINAEQHACLLLAMIQGLAFRWILSNHRFVLREQADAVIATITDGWSSRKA